MQDNEKYERTDIFPAEKEPGYWKKNQSNFKADRAKYKEDYIKRAMEKGKTREQAISAFHLHQRLFKRP